MQISEKEIISFAKKYLKQRDLIELGIGHDCAAIRLGRDKYILATTDQLIEGVHFQANCPVAKIARKLLARNLSDIAAAGGGKNFFALCTIALSSDTHEPNSIKNWFKSFFRALGKYSKKFEVSVCGGDIAKIASGQGKVLTLSLMAEARKEKLCSRSGACDGDLLFGTGYFGNSFKSGHHYNFEPRLREAEFLSGRFTRTMTDISDGLLTDAFHLAESSGLGIILYPEKIPLRRGADLRSALSEGEDYELLFAVSPKDAEKLEKAWRFKTRLSELGIFSKSCKGKIMTEEGINLLSVYCSGYDHFARILTKQSL